MTFLTFGAADVFDGDGIAFAAAEVCGEFRVLVVEFIYRMSRGAVGEVHFRSAVTVDTPATT